MTVYRSTVTAPVKYELLKELNSVKQRNIFALCCCKLLLVCIGIPLLLFFSMNNKLVLNDELDFEMIYTKKAVFGGYGISGNRAKMYMLAHNNKTINVPDLHVSTKKVEEVENFKMICYYSLPIINGTTSEQLLPSMIDPSLCTHINIAFATIKNGTIQPWRESDLMIYTELVSLKQLNPSLKVMLSVEWFSSAGEMALVVATKLNRKIFIEKAVQFLEEYSLDGLDIDWEFPSWPKEDLNQRHDFLLLLKELRQYINNTEREDKLTLSVAVAAPAPIVNQAYDIEEMAKYIDYVNLMAYDFHSYSDNLPVTGANAPLYSMGTEKGYFSTLNTNWSTLYWMDKGMPADKIIVGFPTYGHSFTLFNDLNHGWYAPASGIGQYGADGFVTYSDVCRFIALEDSVVVFDGESKVPYTYRMKEWISFDNEQSIAYKAEFAKWKGYGGVMLFSLNADDFSSTCDGKTTFPLTRRVKDVIEDDQL